MLRRSRIRTKSADSTTTPVKFEDSYNGSILGNLFIPQELLSNIMQNYLDPKTLLNCRQVCQSWKMNIDNQVFRRKAQIKTGHQFHLDHPLKWQDYYLICTKHLFHANLIRNPSGEMGQKHWESKGRTRHWSVLKCTPEQYPPLPNDDDFPKNDHYFLASNNSSIAMQTINLLEAGFTESILDDLQPPILVQFCKTKKIFLMQKILISKF